MKINHEKGIKLTPKKSAAQRKQLRTWLSKNMLPQDFDALAKAEELKESLLKEKGIIFGVDKRIRLKQDIEALWIRYNKEFGRLTYYKRNNDTRSHINEYTTMDIGLNLIQLELEKNKISDISSKAFYQLGSNRISQDREKTTDLIVSIAMEDAIFCSNFSSFTSCLGVDNDHDNRNYDHCNRGGGRLYAMSNTMTLLRESPTSVSANYHGYKGRRSDPPQLPFLLPKKLGRRFLIYDFEHNHSTLTKPYGTINWSLLQLFPFLDGKGIPMVNVGYIDREDSLGIMSYIDSTSSYTGQGVTIQMKPVFKENQFSNYWAIKKESRTSEREDETSCCDCGNYYLDEMITYVRGEPYCEGCFDDTFFTCSCGDIVDHDHGQYIMSEDRTLCIDCFNDMFFECLCGQITPNDEGEYIVSIDRTICFDCYQKTVKACIHCKEEYSTCNMVKTERGFVCNECDKDLVKQFNQVQTTVTPSMASSATGVLMTGVTT
jgi:hypothetical protein